MQYNYGYGNGMMANACYSRNYNTQPYQNNNYYYQQQQQQTYYAPSYNNQQQTYYAPQQYQQNNFDYDYNQYNNYNIYGGGNTGSSANATAVSGGNVNNNTIIVPSQNNNNNSLGWGLAGGLVGFGLGWLLGDKRKPCPPPAPPTCQPPAPPTTCAGHRIVKPRSNGKEYIEHKVKAGETLLKIASMHHAKNASGSEGIDHIDWSDKEHRSSVEADIDILKMNGPHRGKYFEDPDDLAKRVPKRQDDRDCWSYDLKEGDIVYIEKKAGVVCEHDKKPVTPCTNC